MCSNHTNSSRRVVLEGSRGLPEPFRATLGPRGAPWGPMGGPPPPSAIIPIDPAKATIGYAAGVPKACYTCRVHIGPLCGPYVDPICLL